MPYIILLFTSSWRGYKIRVNFLASALRTRGRPQPLSAVGSLIQRLSARREKNEEREREREREHRSRSLDPRSNGRPRLKCGGHERKKGKPRRRRRDCDEEELR